MKLVRRMRIRYPILVGAAIFLSLVSWQLPLAAQENREGIGISPARLTLSGDPGQTLTGNLTVLNGGNETLRYKIYVNDFRVINEDYEKDFEPIKNEVTPVRWFNINPEVRELAPGAQEKVPYSVTIPADTVPRGYYAVIFAETVPDQVGDSTGVARIKRVGSLVYLSVNGGKVEKGDYLGMQAALWQRQQQIKAQFRIENTGNVHFPVEGEVRVVNMLGKTVHRTQVSSIILPATTRRFSPDLSVQQPVGFYRIEGEVKFLDHTVEIGPRWVLVASPLWLATFVLIITAWLAAIVIWVRRRVRRKRK